LGGVSLLLNQTTVAELVHFINEMLAGLSPESKPEQQHLTLSPSSTDVKTKKSNDERS